MSITPLTFTGVSTYSSDLQTVLNRAVQIAQLPLNAMQNADADVLQKKTLVNGLTTPLTDLGNAVKALGTLAAKSAVTATSSDSTTVSVTNAGASAAAVHTISKITSLAKAASETTVEPGYADSDTATVSANGSMRLVVGTTNYDFTLDSETNNLIGLRDKINSLGAGVTASILTTGSSGNFLSVTASTTGATTLKLMDDPGGTGEANILTSNNQGSNAEFLLDNIAISRKSNTVNDIIGGMSFTLEKTDTTNTITLTLATDRSALSNALADFATKYNSVMTLVNAQVGPNAGLLSGDFLIREIQGNMRALSGYQAGGTIQSLADVGLTFDNSGKLNFESTTFTGLSDNQITGAFQYFGSATTGFGQLASKFTQLTDPITGLIKLQSNSYDATDKRLQSSMADLTERINNMQKGLSAKLQLADSLLAQLTSQQDMVKASIQSVTYALYGKSTS